MLLNAYYVDACHSQPSFETCKKISDFILSKTEVRPILGIVTGSGLGAIADLLQHPVSIPFTDIPQFASCSGTATLFPLARRLISSPAAVEGHKGSLVFGVIDSVPAVCANGRVHAYEGSPMWQCVLPIRIMKLMGVKVVIMTNACGAVNPALRIGDIVLLKDHISLSCMTGINALVGLNDERWGPRFPAINKIYDRQLLHAMHHAIDQLGMRDIVSEGVYCHNGGPCYRTVSEIRFIRDCLKADVVGMSTTYEAVAAVHCGLRVVALSLVSGLCVSDHDSVQEVDHDSVIEVCQQRVTDVMKLIQTFVRDINFQ